MICNYECCGKEIERQSHHKRGHKNSYCDSVCYQRARAGYLVNDNGDVTDKRCARCESVFPLEHYARNGKGRQHGPYCKDCRYIVYSAKKFKVPQELIVDLLRDSECFACGSTENLCIDHSHTTGNIRGLLCKPCNTTLGLVQDNPEILESLIRYLKHTGE